MVKMVNFMLCVYYHYEKLKETKDNFFLFFKCLFKHFLCEVKSWLIEKDLDAGRDWGQEEKGTTEDEMAGWHHRLNAHKFEWTLRVGDGQGGLACCNSWGHKESDTTERPNWTELNWTESSSTLHWKLLQSSWMSVHFHVIESPVVNLGLLWYLSW